MRILFFGKLADRIGREIEHAIPAEGCTVAELRRRLAEDFPELAEAPVRACVDQAVVPESAMVRPDQEVAFIPPLSGG